MQSMTKEQAEAIGCALAEILKSMWAANYGNRGDIDEARRKLQAAFGALNPNGPAYWTVK